MITLSLKEFRRRIGELIRARRPVLLTSRGKPVARLIPVKASTSPRKQMRVLKAADGCVDDPAVPSDGSLRLDEYLYGPARPRR